MTGVLAALAGVGGGSGLRVTANNVTTVDSGFPVSGTVTSAQPPNTAVTGGQAPYTYLWAYVSGSTEIATSNPAAPNPVWEATTSGEEVAVWGLTVTDAALNTATVEITITLAWLSFS